MTSRKEMVKYVKEKILDCSWEERHYILTRIVSVVGKENVDDKNKDGSYIVFDKITDNLLTEIYNYIQQQIKSNEIDFTDIEI